MAGSAGVRTSPKGAIRVTHRVVASTVGSPSAIVEIVTLSASALLMAAYPQFIEVDSRSAGFTAPPKILPRTASPLNGPRARSRPAALAGSHRAATDARSRRRCDRITAFFAAVHESAIDAVDGSSTGTRVP